MQFAECGDVDHGVHGANLPALPGDGLHQIPESLHQIGVEGVRPQSLKIYPANLRAPFAR